VPTVSKSGSLDLLESSGLVTGLFRYCFNPLKAELNPICHLLALVGGHHILHVSRIRVNFTSVHIFLIDYNYESNQQDAII